MAATSRWTRQELRFELRRRKMFPPTSHARGHTVAQNITASDLEAELALVPTSHPDRGWHEWELALAREHERLHPVGVPFTRYIERPN
jgi:hypothetical protein